MTESTPESSAANEGLTRKPLMFRVIVPLVIFVAAGAVVWSFFGGGDFLAGLGKTPFVEAEGIVRLNGRPLPGAEIRVYNENDELPFATGFAASDGRFQLYTEVDYRLRKGAYAGRAQVVVVLHRAGRGVSNAGILAVPAKYADRKKTPLKIELSTDPELNSDIRLELFGQPEQTASAERGKVDRLIERYDKNQDEKLQVDEWKKADTEDAELLAQADGNDDQVISVPELRRAFRRMLSRGTLATDDRSNTTRAGFVVVHMFRTYDKDENRVLDAEEIGAISDDDRKQARIGQADRDGDGSVTRRELVDTLQKKD